MKNIFICIVLGLFLISVGVVNAQVDITKSKITRVVDNKKFYVHKVEKGHTLYSLSRAYGVTVKDIAENNVNVMNGLAEGSELLIPLIEPNKKLDFHIVKKGETLFSISKLYETNTADLLKLNPGLTQELKVGQKVYVQSKLKTITPIHIPEALPGEKVVVNGTKYSVHRVVKGETLFAISKKYNIPVEVLSQTNNLQNGEIKVGQSLLLPYGNIQYREKRFFFHEVQKGESLYSISKHYKTDITKIMSDNPCTKSPLKHGMVLKIEISPFNKDVKEQSHKDNIIFHEVAKGETAYSIAKKYNVDYKKLRKENSEYDLELLSDGIILKVPTSRHQIAEYKVNEELRKLENGEDTLYVEKKCECDSISTDISRTIRVAVLLPFYLKANDTINNNKKIISSTEKLFPRSIPFLEFYEGMLVALDTLKQYGYNVSISTYDTQDDTSYVKRIFNSITKNNTDIIIGPVFYNTFQVAARIAKQKNIPIVSPLAAKNCCVDDNNKLIVVNTPNNYRIESTAFYFSQYVDQNFVIIHNGHIQEFDMMKEYKNALATSVEDSLYYNNITFKQVYFAEQGISGVEDALSKNAQNIIIIPSNSQGYVSDIVTQLYKYKSSYDIQLYGLSNWETFDNIELKYLYELNFHFATSNYINYNDVRVISFIENFRNTFSNDPSKFTFQGYDLMMYFVRAVQMYPNNMLNCLDKIKSEGFQVKFDFRKEVDSGAFVNRGNYLIRYNSNFTREEINFRQQDIEKQIQMKAKEMQKNKKTDSILTPNPNYIPFNK